ncbi:hypothetical protein [Pedobacter sp. SYSU D00535]|uniref:hypothetical protein n=1 Tax=Pedobacter sp. SYSU D00535 TaxID=2810308 RepID=UPI001F601712|nr:hypothetical protein [Pedobacter sp. SYSU D00535]
MLNKNARFVVLALAVVLLIWVLSQRVYEIAAIVGLGILYLVWSHFRQGSVALASKAYHNRDYERAEKLLLETADPDKLARSRRGYYEFIMGNIELKKERFDEAEMHFQIASRFPLRSENDKGIVLVQLANLNLRKKEFEKAKAYLEKTKELKISSRVESIVKKIEHEIQKSK